MADVKHRYSRTPNTLPELEGTMRGVYHSRGVVTADELAKQTAEANPDTGDAEKVKMVIRAMMGEVAKHVAQNRRVVMPEIGVTCGLGIAGSLPSLDAEPGEDNPLYVGIYLDDSWREPLQGVVPEQVESSADKPVVYSVEDVQSCKAGVVVGTREFNFVGLNLSVGVEGESLTLMDSAGVTHTAVVTENQVGQRIVAHFATPPAPGKARFDMMTRGLKTPQGKPSHLVKWVTVLAGDSPTPTGDEPVVTSGHSSGYSDPGMIDPNADFIMEGSHLAGASVKVDWTDEGGNERTQTIPAGEVEAEDETITLQQGDWLEACTTVDGAVLTFTVTTSHGSTTYNATVRA